MRFRYFQAQKKQLSKLYKNMSQARENPRGLVAVSIFVRLAESIYRKSNFEDFSKYLDRVSILFYKVVSFSCLKIKILIITEPIGFYILGKLHIGPVMV